VARILVVDDEEPVRGFLAQVLAGDGYEVWQAIHGRQALELVDKERPDLVLSDVMMPVLSGAELCRQLKARADTKDVPVILMTSAGRKAVDGTGCDAYLGKPFDLVDVEALVERLLRESVHAPG
jgi:two-component system, OmpR family, phosphate regulon response regulator PhoB